MADVKYHDVEIAERTEISPTGRPQKVYRITATTSGETTFSVSVPEADFTTENVKRVLTERAELIESMKRP